MTTNLLVAVGGALLAIYGAIRPRHQLQSLIALSILTAGVMLDGLSIADEILLACWILGAVAAYPRIQSTAVKSKPVRFERAHKVLFWLFLLYMILQACRGVVEFGEARKLRWVVFYIMILFSVWLVSKRAPLTRSQIYSTILRSSFVYFSIYIAAGLYSESFRGISRWMAQQTEWGSTAYSVFPCLLAIPVAFSALTSKSGQFRYLAWLTLLSIMIAAFYYDSRSVQFVILIFFSITALFAGIRFILKTAVAYSAILAFFLILVWPQNRDISFFFDDLFHSGSAVFSGEGARSGRDMDRWIHMQVAFTSISDKWDTLLFGTGFRTSGTVISLNLYNLYQEHLPGEAAGVTADASTEGFTAFVVENGLIGLSLLILNMLLVIGQITIRTTKKIRCDLIAIIALAFCWMFLINMLDILLFYFLIMPGGPVLMLAAGEEDATAGSTAGSIKSGTLAVAR